MGQAHVSCYEHTKRSNHSDFSPVGLVLTLQIILKMCLTGRSGRASNQVIRKLKEKFLKESYHNQVEKNIQPVILCSKFFFANLSSIWCYEYNAFLIIHVLLSTFFWVNIHSKTLAFDFPVHLAFWAHNSANLLGKTFPGGHLCVWSLSIKKLWIYRVFLFILQKLFYC